MIRITQTYLNNLAIKHFINAGWTLLYYDLPGGRRSGIGIVSKINKLWEGLYNLSPDILLIKGEEILLVEVDILLSNEYIEKFLKYQSKEEKLREALEDILQTKITKLSFAFVANTKKAPTGIPKSLMPLLYLNYENAKFVQIFISS